MSDAVLGDRAEQHPDEAPVPAGAHDEEARAPGGLDEHLRRMSPDQLGRHGHPRLFPQDLLDRTCEGLLRVLGEVDLREVVGSAVGGGYLPRRAEVDRVVP